MSNNNTINSKTKRRLKIAAFISRFIFILMLAVFALLITENKISTLRYASLLFASVHAILLNYIANIYQLLPKDESKINTILDNANQAQNIISEKKYMIEKYFTRENKPYFSGSSFNVENFLDFINSPVLWLTSLLVSLILFFNPSFLDQNSIQAISISLGVKLFALSILQFLFFSLFVFCVALTISNFFKKVK